VKNKQDRALSICEIYWETACAFLTRNSPERDLQSNESISFRSFYRAIVFAQVYPPRTVRTMRIKDPLQKPLHVQVFNSIKSIIVNLSLPLILSHPRAVQQFREFTTKERVMTRSRSISRSTAVYSIL